MKLYVGNLAFSTSEADVRTMFEQAGAVGSCELVSDKFTGQSRGFAFVEMESSSEGTQAIQRFNDFELDGRKMVVNEARPREARAGGFGGGGFGAPSGSRGPGGGAGGAAAFGAKRKSGKGSRRNARSAKRDRKACW